jgi:hypothetical protein
VSVAAFVYLAVVLVKALIFGDPVSGYPSTMCVILFLGNARPRQGSKIPDSVAGERFIYILNIYMFIINRNFSTFVVLF